jgi:hypothetical protein
MHAYFLGRVSDGALEQELTGLVARDRETLARLLSHIAEFDLRKLFAPAGYPSMHAYCVGALRFSGDEAYKRIQAARAARSCPAIYDAIAEGRLHLAAVVMLAPKLDSGNAEELLAAATHKTRNKIAELLAERFPQADVPVVVRAIPAQTQALTNPDSSPKHHPGLISALPDSLVSEPVGSSAGDAGSATTQPLSSGTETNPAQGGA